MGRRAKPSAYRRPVLRATDRFALVFLADAERELVRFRLPVPEGEFMIRRTEAMRFSLKPRVRPNASAEGTGLRMTYDAMPFIIRGNARTATSDHPMQSVDANTSDSALGAALASCQYSRCLNARDRGYPRLNDLPGEGVATRPSRHTHSATALGGILLSVAFLAVARRSS